MRLTLPEIKRKISKLIPDDIDSDVTLEAGSIAIITKQPGWYEIVLLDGKKGWIPMNEVRII